MALRDLNPSSKKHRGSRARGTLADIRSAPVVVIVRSDFGYGNAEIWNHSPTVELFMCAFLTGGDCHKEVEAGIVVFKT